jgi:hypothetical protein
MSPTRISTRTVRAPVHGELDGPPDDWMVRPR